MRLSRPRLGPDMCDMYITHPDMIRMARLSLLGVRRAMCKMTLVAFVSPFYIYLKGNLSKKNKENCNKIAHGLTNPPS